MASDEVVMHLTKEIRRLADAMEAAADHRLAEKQAEDEAHEAWLGQLEGVLGDGE